MAGDTPSEVGPTGRLAGLVLAGLRLLLGVSVVAMMGLTFVDVLGRYFFHAPIGGANEITQFLLAITVFAALPLVTWRNGHIVVTLFESKGPPGRRARVIGIGVTAVSALVLAFVTYLLWREAGTLDRADAVTGFLQWRLSPLVYILCFLTALTLVLQIVRLIGQLRR